MMMMMMMMSMMMMTMMMMIASKFWMPLTKTRQVAPLRLARREGEGGEGVSCALENQDERGGGGDCRVYCSFQHLHAIVVKLAHDDAPVAINSNTTRAAELTVAAALGAYCAHMGAITVP